MQSHMFSHTVYTATMNVYNVYSYITSAYSRNCWNVSHTYVLYCRDIILLCIQDLSGSVSSEMCVLMHR